MFVQVVLRQCLAKRHRLEGEHEDGHSDREDVELISKVWASSSILPSCISFNGPILFGATLFVGRSTNVHCLSKIYEGESQVIIDNYVIRFDVPVG